jgi:hypothetical protein
LQRSASTNLLKPGVFLIERLSSVPLSVTRKPRAATISRDID